MKPLALLAALGGWLVLGQLALAAPLSCGPPSAPLFLDRQELRLRFYGDHASLHDQVPDALAKIPGIVEVAEADAGQLLAAQFGSRGNSRLQCKPKPLRLTFEPEGLVSSWGLGADPFAALKRLFDERSSSPLTEGHSHSATIFRGLGGDVKMVNECEPFALRGWPGSKDPIVRRSMLLREYYAYRMYGLLSPLSLAVRLAQVAYVNADGSEYWRGQSFFLEPIRALRARCGLVKASYLAERADRSTELRVYVFQRLIGNSDFATFGHNMELGADSEGRIQVVPYDFDLADFVTAEATTDFSDGDQAMESFLTALGAARDNPGQRAVLEDVLDKKAAVLDLYAQSVLSPQVKRQLMAAIERRFGLLEKHLKN